jgi:hypothetical protein
MSRETVADALAWCDYGILGCEDNIERDLRLAHADNLLSTGAVIDVEDLLVEWQYATWYKLAKLLPPRGWMPIAVWLRPGDLELYWVPRGSTHKQVEEGEEVDVIEVGQFRETEGHITVQPAGWDEVDDWIDFTSVETFIRWLDARVEMTT